MACAVGGASFGYGMQWLNEVFTGDKSVGWIAILAACGIAVLVALAIVYRLVFAHRLRVPGGRTRQPRLGLVDAFSLDGQRQLVLIRRDNVEHLVMIGGPNDVLVESQINRALAPSRETNGAPAQPASPARRRAEPALVSPPALAQPAAPLPVQAVASIASAAPHPISAVPRGASHSGSHADGFGSRRPRSGCSRIAVRRSGKGAARGDESGGGRRSPSCGFAAGTLYAATRVDAAADHASERARRPVRRHPSGRRASPGGSAGSPVPDRSEAHRVATGQVRAAADTGRGCKRRRRLCALKRRVDDA